MNKVFQFSGGADSLAALFLKGNEWGEMVVLWCNTGSAYPETQELMYRLAQIVPHFEEVASNKNRWEDTNGTAVDVTPERYTLLGHAIHGTKEPLYTSYLRCCSANIWLPLDKAARDLGARHIIRGQRQGESKKAPIRSGHIDPSGVLYEFPVENWSKEEVLVYCKKTCPELLPSYYANGEVTSHDCWDCIAYLDENQQRIRNLPPEKQAVVFRRLRAYHDALVPDMDNLEGLLQ